MSASDIAQIVIAGTGVAAFFGAALQIHLTRLNAARTRVYAYAERLKQTPNIELVYKWQKYWQQHTFKQWEQEPVEDRAEWLVLTNLIEEMAALYDRKLVDRDVLAETLGVLTETLWKDCANFVTGIRAERNNPWLYDYWEQMQLHTPTRRAKAKRKIMRRRRRRELLRGD